MEGLLFFFRGTPNSRNVALDPGNINETEYSPVPTAGSAERMDTAPSPYP